MENCQPNHRHPVPAFPNRARGGDDGPHRHACRAAGEAEEAERAKRSADEAARRVAELMTFRKKLAADPRCADESPAMPGFLLGALRPSKAVGDIHCARLRGGHEQVALCHVESRAT